LDHVGINVWRLREEDEEEMKKNEAHVDDDAFVNQGVVGDPPKPPSSP
jgi:hypothetical protein